MASNFRIFSHRNNSDLYLRIMGDFDGSSAFELINTLQAQNGNVEKIIINTNGLSSIHPFGLGVFQKNCTINKRYQCVKFIGKYGDTMTPRGVTRFGDI